MFGLNLSEVSLPAFIFNLEAFRAELFSDQEISTGQICVSQYKHLPSGR